MSRAGFPILAELDGAIEQDGAWAHADYARTLLRETFCDTSGERVPAELFTSGCGCGP